MIKKLDFWLTETEIDQIHNDTLEILWERGMRVHHPKALKLLANAGARIDSKENMVKFPPELVEQCLETVPSSFAMGGRLPERNLNVGLNGEPIVRATSGAEGYIPLEKREYRPCLMEDLIEWSQVLEGLDNVDICAGFYPNDAPLHTRDVLAMKTMLEYTTKPVFINPYDYDTTKAMIDMAVAIRGGREKFKENPLISILTSATAPGDILDYCVEMLFLAGEYGMPVEINSGPLMGGTAPVTVAGCILQNNVEILSLLTISQLAHPGTPLIHRGITMAMDMSSGNGVMGSIECALAQVAQAQLVGTKYNFPVSTYGPITDATLADGQSQIERTIQTLLAGVTGSPILLAAGILDDLNIMDPVQLVIDDEIVSLLKRLLRGFEVNEETLAKDLIKSMPPGGNYLAETHTFEHFRNEHYISRLFSSNSRAAWEEAGGKDLNQRARERGLELVKSYQEVPLDAAVQKELDAIYNDVTERKR